MSSRAIIPRMPLLDWVLAVVVPVLWVVRNVVQWVIRVRARVP